MERFFAYEKQLNDSITGQHMTVLCTYPLAKSGAAEVLDVVHAHQVAIARRQGEWEVIETPELIQAKAEIRRLNEDLEQRVVERTSELRLANKELRKEMIERKQAEASLHVKEQEFRAIVENAPDPIARYDRSFRRTYVNPAFARAMGLPAEALIGRPIFSSFRDAGVDVKDDELAQIRQRFEDVVDTGKSCEFEVTVPMPAGRRYFSVRFFPELDLNGSVINVLEIARDITERKQAEEALDERLRFETLVTELSAAFASLSPNEVDREIDKWLQTLVEFLGVDRASFFQLREDWTTLYLGHSYTVPGIEPLSLPPIGINEQFPWITDQLRRGNTIKWSRIPDDLPEQAAKEKKYAATTGAKSVLNIPVLVGGSVICTISFTSIGIYCDWPDATVARLRLVGEIFAAAVERKRAEAALRKSEEQFRQMAENIREVFWLATADLGKMLYISPAYEAVWGQSRESLYREPRSFFAAIHAEDRSRVVAIIERDREQGFEVEYRVVRPDGSIRWVRDRGFPIKDELGRFYRVAGIAEDVTERKHAEDELRQQKEILQQIFDHIPLMINFVEADGRIKLVNREWERTLGWSLEEIREQNLDIFAECYPDPQYRQEILKFIAEAKGEWADFKTRVRDGRVIDTTFVRVLLSDRTSIGIGQDITERKRAEEARREAEQKYKDIFENAGEGIFQSTPDGRYIAANPALARMFGFASPEELIHSCQDISRQVYVDPARREEFKRQIEDHGAVRGFELEVFRKDGSRLWISVNARAVQDEQGAIQYYEGTAQDITERKAAEENLKATSEQLRALSARLQSAREEEGARIAREIHDELGSVLTSLKWDLEGTDRILSSPLEASQLSILRERLGASMKLTDLAISAIRRIASELRPSILDDLGLVAAVEWQVQQFQARTGIVCYCDCSLEKVEFGEEQSTAVFRILQEALTNILRHAQATRVDVTMVEEAGSFILTIRDNGRGITEHEKSGQLSIGLLGMRERAHLIRGEIDITGVEGEGTTVTVRLPIALGVHSKAATN